MRELQMNSIIEKRSKGNSQKPAKFIAPGYLARARGYGSKTSKFYGDFDPGHKSTSGTSLQGEEQEHPYTSNRKVGAISSHTLTVYFGDHELKERDVTEDTSLLDILKMYGDGIPLRNDRDVLAMFKDHEFVENIDVYVEVDKTAKPLPFKLPEDNSTIGLVSKVPQVRDVSILEFYNNCAVGKNHTAWSRHLGKIVRNKHICSIRVHIWKEITEPQKDHMWDSVKEYFSNSKIELYSEHTLEHMRILWTAWGSSLNKNYVVPCKTKYEAMKKVPEGMNKEDWEWLVVNKYCTEKFQKISTQNSTNRHNVVMPHRTGSQPHRQLIYEMGGKVGNPPDVLTIFKGTHQKKGEFVQPEAQKNMMRL